MRSLFRIFALYLASCSFFCYCAIVFTRIVYVCVVGVFVVVFAFAFVVCHDWLCLVVDVCLCPCLHIGVCL